MNSDTNELIYFQTGNEDLDQVLIVFLSTGMFVGGVVGCILDNILPGRIQSYSIIEVYRM